MNKNLSVIILAAGKGKRMNNPDIPKVLALLDNKPLLYYVITETQNLNPEKIVIVVGHKKELVIDFCKNSNFNSIEFAEQVEQLGTGNAVAICEDLFNNYNGSVLILAGDVPLLQSSTLLKFIELHFSNNSDCSVLSTIAPNPYGYGRIVRDENRNFLKITEHKDADEKTLLINEINSGIYLVNSEFLFKSLKKVTNSNNQGEYYLTDIISILKKENNKVFAFDCAEFNELQGINTNEELLKAQEYYLSKYNN